MTFDVTTYPYRDIHPNLICLLIILDKWYNRWYHSCPRGDNRLAIFVVISKHADELFFVWFFEK